MPRGSDEFDPTRLDGLSVSDVTPPKSNWARQLSRSPFYAYATTCGITFTYGGLKIDKHARVLDNEDKPIEGLFACGEIVGGLFYDNYLGGAGLMAGAVFGRIAGAAAAARAVNSAPAFESDSAATDFKEKPHYPKTASVSR